MEDYSHTADEIDLYPDLVVDKSYNIKDSIKNSLVKT
jgi:hypothetical protein